MTDLFPHSTSSLGRLYGVNGKRLSGQYRTHLSDFQNWSQRKHAKKWLLYPQNFGSHLSIDETSLSQGELHTILTNKAAKGGKASIVAIIAGTKAETVIAILRKIPEKLRKKVTEITLDMAGYMALIAKKCFPRATQVTDRFHVQQLALEAVQEMRVKYRWEVLDAENEAIGQAKATQNASISHRCFPMKIRSNNCWRAAGMCSIKNRVIGPKVNVNGLNCSSAR